MNRLPIYNIVLGDASGICKMSLVECPAVDIDFQAYSKESLAFSINEEQHIVFGCALRANYPIYRRSVTLGEYYTVFSAEVIKQLYEKFMIEGHQAVNLEHGTDTEGVYLIQSMIKDSKNGISPVGFESIEDGSWFCAYKVENEAVWEQVKNGDFKGFSIEGWFNLEPQEDEIESLVDELLSYDPKVDGNPLP